MSRIVRSQLIILAALVGVIDLVTTLTPAINSSLHCTAL